MTGSGPRANELRLVPAAVAGWVAGGLAIGVGVGQPPVVATAVLWVGAVVAVVAAAGLRPPLARTLTALLAIALAVAALIVTSVVVRDAVRSPVELRRIAGTGRAAPMELVVTGAPTDGRFRADLIGVELVGERYAMSAPVLVFANSGMPRGRVAIGSTLRTTAALQTGESGDSVAFLLFPRGDLIRAGAPPPVLAAADGVRARFAAQADRLPDPGGGLLPGLAIGDTSRVGAALDTAMKTTSLSHLTAVSGANCAVVVGLAMAVTAALGLRRGIRITTSAIVLVAFVVLVTPEPSVLRAAVMAGLVLLALGSGRAARGIPLLCIAVIVLLAIDPWLSRDYGFALSVLATAGLLALTGPLVGVLERWMPTWLALLVAVPTAAQLACQPVLLMLNPSLPVYGVIANLLAEPAAPVATVIGLIACALAPVLPGPAAVFTAIAWVPASWIAAVATFFAGLPGARGAWPVGAPGIALLVSLSVVALVAVLARGHPRWRRGSAAVLIVALIGYAGTAVGIRVTELVGRPGDWVYAECDIGQGDATVIRSAGRIALVDTGPKPERLSRCLDELGITRIDLLVLTHYDLDHVGGTDAVLGMVDRAMVGPVADASDQAIRDGLLAHGARVDQVSVGESGRLGDLDWRVVWPPPSGVEPGNAASVTLLVIPASGCRIGCLSAILLGDLGQESQARLLGSVGPGPVDVVKVAHHGSADQEPHLYESLHATVGLIGVGADNDYRHPTAMLLGILEAVGTRITRTDVEGLVLVAAGPAPGQVVVWTQRSASAEAVARPG